MWLKGRQASQRCLRRVDFEAVGGGRAEAATASWVRTTPFGVAGAAAGRDDEGVPVVHRERLRAVAAGRPRDDPGRPQHVEEALAGRRGQALVDRGDGAALVPGGP